MNKTNNKSILEPIVYGVFVSSIILVLLSALFSYQQEAGVMIVGMLALSLLFINRKPNFTKESAVKNLFSSAAFFLVPLFLSFFIIKGDGRSWFLILIVVLTCWLIFFNKKND